MPYDLSEAIIARARENGGEVTAAEVYRLSRGSTAAVESLMARGLLAPDQMPPRVFFVTQSSGSATGTTPTRRC